MTTRQLVILAGGKGTRLQSRLNGLPKPLAQVGGIPILEHQILLAKKYEFTDILILVEYGALHIMEFCEQHGYWGLNICLVREDTPLGTAGAILNSYSFLHDDFIVMYGDTMLNVNLEKMWDYHIKYNSAATLFVHPNDHPHDSDLVEVDKECRIIHFHPYPHKMDLCLANLVNAALYVMNKNSLAKYLPLSGSICDFGKNLFPLMLKDGMYLYSYKSREYIKDAGTPERLDKVNLAYQTGKIDNMSLACSIPAIFLDRDGVINQANGYVTTPDKFILISGVANSIKAINNSNYLAVVITNQPVVARGECTLDQLKLIHNKMETLLGYEGAYVDDIYFCPHHPDKGYVGEIAEYKIRCDCRKPEIGLIVNAQKAHNINIAESWFIGDTYSDILAAKNASLKSVLLRNEYTCKNNKFYLRPDFEFYNLSEAVDYIIATYDVQLNEGKNIVQDVLPSEWIAIGGVARSGKSTFASVLKVILWSKQIKSHIINLDNWLKNISERPDDDAILSKYNLTTLCDFIQKLQQLQETTTFKLPVYDRITFGVSNLVEELVVSPDDVIIFEGVISFLIPEIIEKTKKRIFVKSNEDLRKQLFFKEYLFRGMDYDKILDLFVARELKETPIIKTCEKLANHYLQR